MSSNGKQRDVWSSKIGFILAAAGSAVGLGNLWKFPYSAGQNGGGAFVLVYLGFLIFIGMPLMLAAIAMGRKTQLSAVGAYRKLNNKWAFAGGLGVICGFFILALYSTVGGWVISYVIKACTGQLMVADANQYAIIFNDFISSPAGAVGCQAVFLLITAVIVIKGISGGIEKASSIMMPALFILMIIIGIRSVTLDGAYQGIEFLFKPSFKDINGDVVMNAMGQMFFSISIGIGAMITYGSYLGKDSNLVQAGGSIPVLDTFVALLAGVATLPAVFAMGFQPTGGPGLMFVTLPAVFASMPLGGVFCILFFILVLFAALTSSIAMLEVCVSYFVDERSAERFKSSIIITTVILLMGIPSTLSFGILKDFHVIGNLNVFDFYDKLTSNILMTTGGFLLAVFVGWIWGADNAIEEMKIGADRFRLAGVWKFLIKYIVPVAIGIVLINYFRDFMVLIK